MINLIYPLQLLAHIGHQKDLTNFLLTGTVIMGAVGGLLAVAALFYFKRGQAIKFATEKGMWLWNEWLTSLDPKKIGVMYIIVAGLMLLRGALDAGMMRAHQAIATGEAHGLLSSEHFQQIFSAHGSIMIFFVAMGFMFGLINLVVPQQIGARDVAFPFMNSISFWLFVAGAAIMNLSLFIGGDFSAAGWLAYPPLSELAYSPGPGVDFWIWSLQVAGIGSLLSGINFFVTIFKLRRPGMSFMKMPLFVWSVLGSLVLIIFAFPILTATLALLALDRTLGMHFFTADGGGNAMMYVNLIWAWGHPEVYILILPAFGVFSEVVATFSRKRLFGYISMVWAIVAIVFLSFSVWLHHFFTMGAGPNVNAVFGIMTMIIAVPTGIKVFNWLFTMYRGRVRLTSPMLWFLGFVVTFTIGGVSGVLLAVPAIDFQVHNSLFLVAHFHNVIIGGVLFGYFAGLTYWFPKMFGFTLNEFLGKCAFWCWLTGFMLAFMPLYILGMMGATRRLDHYDPSLGWQPLFIVAASGVLVLGIGVGFQLLQLVVSIIQRKKNMVPSGDPWDGRTLEWSTPWPTPEYNFATLPPVAERDALWEVKKSQKAVGKPAFEAIVVPKGSPIGIFIAVLATVFGFAFTFHVWALAVACVVGIILCLILRITDDHTEHVLTADEVARIEAVQPRKYYA